MKKETSSKKSVVNMPLVNPNAAGIDIGDTIHAVAVPAGRDKVNVKSFGAMNVTLKKLLPGFTVVKLIPLLWKVKVFTRNLCLLC